MPLPQQRRSECHRRKLAAYIAAAKSLRQPAAEWGQLPPISRRCWSGLLGDTAGPKPWLCMHSDLSKPSAGASVWPASASPAAKEPVVTPPGLEPEPLGPKPSVLPITPRGIRTGTSRRRRANRPPPNAKHHSQLCNTPRSRRSSKSLGLEGWDSEGPGGLGACRPLGSDARSGHSGTAPNRILTVVTPPGLEPGMVEPESTVLPITPRGSSTPRSADSASKQALKAGLPEFRGGEV